MRSQYHVLYICLIFCALALCAVIWGRRRPAKPDSRFFEGEAPVNAAEAPHEPVDPWVLQRALMIASDQEAPTIPMVTKTSLLYYALILEEAAETGHGLRAVIGEQEIDDRKLGPRLNMLIGALCHDMHEASVTIRSMIQNAPDFSIRPTREQAKEILDGTTDITVVNCGFSIAVGMLGDIAYERTVKSNLSKANPATGKIDKDPSGKWIKGPNYHPPFLEDLIG